MKIIEIVVSPTGEARLETQGFSGSSCRDASRLFEEALGQRGDERLTAEFHQVEPAKQQVRQQG
jgi:hypothetical protein